MNSVFIIITILCLGIIIYQDVKDRAISVWLFPVLLSLFIGSAGYNAIFRLTLSNAAINLALLALVYFCISIYFSIKNRKWVNLANTYLGWGDMLLLLVLSFAFSPFNFILFVTASCVFALIVWTVLHFSGKAKQASIPLAAFISFAYALLLVMSRILNFNLYYDLLEHYV